jgi:hypothetical protein
VRIEESYTVLGEDDEVVLEAQPMEVAGTDDPVELAADR